MSESSSSNYHKNIYQLKTGQKCTQQYASPIKFLANTTEKDKTQKFGFNFINPIHFVGDHKPKNTVQKNKDFDKNNFSRIDFINECARSVTSNSNDLQNSKKVIESNYVPLQKNQYQSLMQNQMLKGNRQSDHIKYDHKSQIQQKPIPIYQSQPRNNKEQKNKSLQTQYLQKSLQKSKQQIQSLKNLLIQKQKSHKQQLKRYLSFLQTYKNQITSLQRQVSGQTKLIEQYQQKYHLQVEQKQKIKKQKNKYQIEVKMLAEEVKYTTKQQKSNRQVSMELLRENQKIKQQLKIQVEKYTVLLEDYDALIVKNQRVIKNLQISNKQLIRNNQQLLMEIKIFQKDKEIQKLLIYEQTIDKRQRQTYTNFPSSSKYEFLPRKLNFEQQTVRMRTNQIAQKQNVIYSNLNQDYSNQNTGRTQSESKIVELQKNKIVNLESKIKILEKRNKELQAIMVSCVK